MAVDYSKFYLLDDPLATRPLRLESTYPNLTNEQVWQLFLGQWKPESPIQLVAFQGGQATDFLWSSDFFIICISSRVVALLTEQGFTGWATYPVEVYGRKRERLPDYHGFSVVAECRQDLSRSPIIDDPEVPGRKVYKGLYFDEHQWDGSDFLGYLELRLL